MEEAIKRFYGFYEDDDDFDLGNSSYGRGIIVNNLQYHPDQDTETEIAVSAFIHHWSKTFDSMGVDIGAPDDYDQRTWKFFLIDKKDNHVTIEYDWDPIKEKRGAMTYYGKSLFGNWVCGVIAERGFDIKHSMIPEISVSLNVPEYVGNEIAEIIKKEARVDYNPRSFRFKVEKDSEIRWSLMNNEEIILNTDTGIIYGIDPESFQDLIAYLQYLLEDYEELTEEDNER